jgi:hypothetical protein
MDEQPTCGRGLAEHSVLPAKLAELTAAVAENLEAHMKALDPKDPHARAEHEAYAALVREHRETAADLKATATRMAGYRDLPMAPHDPTAMTHPRVREAFERLIRTKEALRALLQETADRDQQLLAQMRASQR